MLQKVRPGQKWKPDARAHNALVDIASAFTAGRFGGGGMGSLLEYADPVRVENNTGGDLDQFEVVGIGGVTFARSDNTNEFDAGRFILDGETPVVATHTGKFAILLEPIASGSIGRATMSGVVPCILDVNATWHEYADVKASSDELDSKPGGGARILWQESGTGAGKRALIRFVDCPMVIAGVNVDTAFTTTDGTETADIDWCNVAGYSGQNITIENHDASTNHIFSGDAADVGTVWYDVLNDKWRLIQMEC